MSYGPVQTFAGTIASGASSTEVDVAKSWSKVLVDISSMSTAAAFSIYGSADGSTYRPVFERVATSTVQYQALTVASGVGANGGITELPFAFRYLQFRASAVVSGGVAIKAICID